MSINQSINQYFVLLLSIVFSLTIVFTTTVSVTAQESEQPPSIESEDHAATQYSNIYNVSVAEAQDRLSLQASIGGLHSQLSRLDSFAGLWIENQPRYKVIVAVTDLDRDVVQSFIDDAKLTEVVEVRTAKYTFAELRDAQIELTKSALDLEIPVNSAISVQRGRVEIFVVDPQKLEDAFASAEITLPDYVALIKVEKLAEPALDIYGGRILSTSGCTSGFSVQSYDRRLGISTAAHCNGVIGINSNEQTGQVSDQYLSNNLIFQSESFGGHGEVQWLTAPTLTVKTGYMMGSGILPHHSIRL